jgi:hypothetical protein
MLTASAAKLAAVAVQANKKSRKGFGKMLQGNAIREPMETMKMRATTPQAKQTEDVLGIEQVLRRAREIHRLHGGLFGYDFDDWAQAWSEQPQRSSRMELGLAEEMKAEELILNTGEISESCFGCTE